MGWSRSSVRLCRTCWQNEPYDQGSYKFVHLIVMLREICMLLLKVEGRGRCII